jgi:hypothetical protein
MCGECGKEYELGTVKTYGWSDGMVVGGEGTSYTCGYIDGYRWIINIISWQSFTIDGGILKYGYLNSLNNNVLEYYFSVINGIDAYIKMRYIEIIFVSDMNSLIYIKGGVVCLEHVKLENQMTNWHYSLINVECDISSVIIELFSLYITNCFFSGWTSAIVRFHPSFGYSYPVFLNVSFLYLLHITLDTYLYTFGGLFQFFSNHLESGFILLLFSFGFFFIC